MIADISELLLQLGLSGTVTDAERAMADASLKRAESAVKQFLFYDPEQKTRTEFYPQMDYSGGQSEEIWEANETHAYIRRQSTAASDELYLKHIPVRSITTLHIDYDGRSGAKSGAFAASTLKTQGEDYWLNFDQLDSGGNKICMDGIVRSIGLWPSNPGSVKVVYVCGYTAKELHGQDSVIDAHVINETVINEAVRRFHIFNAFMKKTRTGFTPGLLESESLGDYSYSMDNSSLLGMLASKGELLQASMDALEQYVNYSYQMAG